MDNLKNYCLRCEFETNHRVIANKDYRSDNDEYDYSINYMIVECLGCERISFREDYCDIESAYLNEKGEWIPEITIEIFPKKVRTSKSLQNSHILPSKIKTVYNEAIKAYNAECFILSGVAFRAIIEAICLDNDIAGNNLQKKINNMVKKKLITERESKRLHSIRFMGNDSVHEMKVPNESSLKIVFYIIEHLLNNLYLIDYTSKNHLETIINEYSEFEKLLKNSITTFEKDEEIPLARILGKKVRRLNGRLSDFDKELKSKIELNEFTLLRIGKVDVFGNSNKQVQHYIITK